MSTNDPLLDRGLSEHEVRLYRYMLALQALSFGNRANPAISAEHVRAFIQRFGATRCTVCERYFFSGVIYCTVHNTPTIGVSDTELCAQVEKWEEFRRKLTEISRIKITRTSAIGLYYYHTHPQER